MWDVAKQESLLDIAYLEFLLEASDIGHPTLYIPEFQENSV